MQNLKTLSLTESNVRAYLAETYKPFRPEVVRAAVSYALTLGGAEGLVEHSGGGLCQAWVAELDEFIGRLLTVAATNGHSLVVAS